MLTWNLADLFEAVADAVAERPAVVADEVRLSFGELDERANRLAHVLADLGVGAGDRVALVLRNGHQYLEAMLASFKLAAIPVNVNTRYTTDELRYLLADAGPRIVLHEPDLALRVSDAIDGTDCGAGAGGRPSMLACDGGYETMLAAASPARPGVERSGDAHYVLYTGGTTGLPKGVVWRHEDLLFAALGGGNPGGDPAVEPAEVVTYAQAGRTRCLPASPFTHGTAHWTALSTLLHGGSVIVDTGLTFDPARLWALASRERATILVIVGDAFARPLADALAAGPSDPDLSDLLVILSGGAVLSPVVRDELLARLPWVAVVDGYGTSETGGQGQMPMWAGQTRQALLRFHVDEDTKVLDDAGRPAPPGSGLVGRLARRGHLPLGYLGDPAGTSDTFVVLHDQRWAIPGDLARIEADGSVTLLGRGLATINSGGEKVFPDEVEMVLKAYPGVFDAVVVGLTDERFGQRVAAAVAPRPGMTIDDDELQQHCRDRLADFKVPRRVVMVDEVRRRPSGKLDLAWAAAKVAASTEP
ncbi:MAG: AMP-binding protein [Acidimicrobiales bacterium]